MGTMRALSGVNIALEIDRFEGATEKVALTRYIRPELLGLSAPGTKHSTPGAFFARAGVLVAMKGIFGPSKSYITQETPFDPFRVGDLCLDANELAFPDPPSLQNLNDFDLVVNMLPAWDLYNPRFLGYSLARYYRMIELFVGYDPVIANLKSGLTLSSALEFDGLSLVDFAAVAFGLFAHVRARADLNVLVGKSEGFVLDANTFLSDTAIPKSNLDKFLARRSWTFDQFQEEIAGPTQWTISEFPSRTKSPGFSTDFRVFREHPLMNLGDGFHLAIDLQFLEELVGPGLFFHVLSSFEAKKQRQTVLDLWGRIFELLVVELLEYFYPSGQSNAVAPLLRPDFTFEAPRRPNADDGQVDALLDFGHIILMFECKHFLLSQSIKDSLDPAKVEEELRKKLVENQDGERKAVRQLVNMCAAVRTGAIPTGAGKIGSPQGNAVLYPIVVVADAAMETFGVNKFLNKIFQNYATDIGGEVRPLTIMSIQELEEALPYIAAGTFTWGELLDSRFYREEGDEGLSHVRLWSLHQAIYDLLTLKGAPSIPNDLRKKQFDRIANEILSVYSGNAKDPRPSVD